MWRRSLLCLLAVPSALAAVAPPPLGSTVFIVPSANPFNQALRHCNYYASFDAYEEGSDDFRFTLVPALNSAPAPAFSLRSVNFPEQHLTYKASGLPAGSRVGIEAAGADPATASWTLAATGAGNGAVTLTTLSQRPALVGALLTKATNASGPCNAGRNHDARLEAAGAGGAAAQAFVLQTTAPSPGPSPSPAPAPAPVPALVQIDASRPVATISEAVLGCHMDPGFGNDPMAWTSALIYGQGFPANEPAKVSAWHDVSTGQGSAALDAGVIMNPNVSPPAATLALTKTGGSGIVGWANRGIGGEGLVLQGGKDYEGYLVVLAPAGGTLQVALVDRTANATLAAVSLQVAASPQWQKVPFSGLTPAASTGCTGIAFGSDPGVDCGEAPKAGMNPGIVCVRCDGEVSIGLSSVGALHVGFATLQPGAWGRFGDLPVSRAGSDMLQAMGFRSIRQGGSVSYSLRWKDWRGAPEQRAAMNHVWGPDLVAPWGPFELLDMTAALNIKPIITLACDLNTAEDWGDLVEYLYGDETTAWGAVRIHNDSHPAPYIIDTFELGNEQQNPDFLAQIQAIEARRATIPGAPEWYFMYPENAGPNASTSAAIVASGVAGYRVMADCHVGASGGIPCAEASTIWQQFNGSGVNCETNAVTSHLQRGVQEAADLITWFSQPADVASRLRARTASFCTQRSGQMRDIWDQGLSFFLPNMTWLQPPGVVHAMLRDNWEPNALAVTLSGGGGKVSAAAQVAADRSRVVVELANLLWGAAPGAVSLALGGFAPAGAVDLYLMAEPGSGAANSTAGNTPANPTYIQAVHSTLAWPASGTLNISMPPLSVAVLVLHSA